MGYLIFFVLLPLVIYTVFVMLVVEDRDTRVILTFLFVFIL